MQTPITNILTWFILIFLLFLVGCDVKDSGSDPDPDPVQKTYSFSAAAVPAEGGSVIPTSGTFAEGSTVNVQATANEGWEFAGWTDGIESGDNPLSFAIDRNVSLTGNFIQVSSAYLFVLAVSDDEVSIELKFGQKEGASDGFDTGSDEDAASGDSEAGFDVEAPPSPPQGALHAWFENDARRLFEDYRSYLAEETSWTLHFQPGQTADLLFTWSLEEEYLNGSVMLTGGNGLQVDMLAEESLTVDAGQYSELSIIYKLIR